MMGLNRSGNAPGQCACPKTKSQNGSEMHSHERDGSQATNLVESAKNTEQGALGVVEVLLPCLEVLDGIKEHAAQRKELSARTYTAAHNSFFMAIEPTHPS